VRAAGFFADPRGTPLYHAPGSLPPRGSARSPLVYLPTELSVSTHSQSDSRAEMTSLPSLNSTMTGCVLREWPPPPPPPPPYPLTHHHHSPILMLVKLVYDFQ